MIEIILKHPIASAAGTIIEKITLRRGKRADLRAAAKFSDNETDQESLLFARLSGLALEDIDELDLADNAELVRQFRAMVGDAPKSAGDVDAGRRVSAPDAEAAAD